MRTPQLMRQACLHVALLVTIGNASPSHNTNGRPCDDVNTLDVAIVGAGVAGTYSAYSLRHRNYSVGVFEHSDRVGGRLFTTHLPDVPDRPVDLGGMRFKDRQHVLVNRLVTELGLRTRNFMYWVNESSSDHRIYRRGVSMTVPEFKSGVIPYNLTAEEKENQAQLALYLFQKLTNDTLDDLTEEKLLTLTVPDGRKLYMLSTHEAMSLVASPEAARFVLEEDHFDSNLLSATDFIYARHGAHSINSTLLAPVDGMNEIPKRCLERFLSASASHTVHINRRLSSIQAQCGGGYKLTFRKTQTLDGVTQDINGVAMETVCAKKVILALPKYALRLLRWRPVRTKEYRALLHNTILVHASKVYMAFPRAWWLEDALYPTTRCHADELGEIYDWGCSNVTGSCGLLVSYTKLDGADQQFAINNGLGQAFPDSLDSRADQPTVQSTVASVQGEKLSPLLRYSDDLDPINGSAAGENKVTEPLKNYLLDQLSNIFGVPRADIPEPVSSIAQFWVRYPYGGGWVFTRAGYRNGLDLKPAIRRPSADDDVFVVGSDFARRGLTGWAEGALNTVETVVGTYF